MGLGKRPVSKGDNLVVDAEFQRLLIPLSADERYVAIEQRIDSSESDAIQDRWRFGQMMLAERKGRRLPNGRMEALIKLTGKSKSELSYRAQFAEMCPTKEELSNAVGQFKSWHAIVESLSGKEKAYASKSEGDTNTWLTPPELVRRLGVVFDLDPCAAPNPAPFVHALENWSQPEIDGLLEDWKGRVWLNPPYGRETPKWLEKMAAHKNGIVLVFDCAGARYWHQFVWPLASAVLFLSGHIKFRFPDGRKSTGAAFPSALIAYGAENVEALRRCGLAGSFMRLPAERFHGVQASSL